MPRGPYWTARDDARLRFMWGGGYSVEQIAARLGRTALATYMRARVLGMQTGAPQGWEYLKVAARRTGFSHTEEMRRVLEWAGVAIRPALAPPCPGRRFRCHIVETDAVNEAVERWLKAEPVEVAARRRGLNGKTLRRWLAAIGITGPARKVPLRVTDDQVERALQGVAA